MRINETPHPKFTQLASGHFREGNEYQNWREHGTDDYLAILTLSGKGRFASGGGEAIVAEHDLVLLRPGTRHDYGTSFQSDYWELLWAHFHPRPHWPILLDLPEIAPGVHLLSLQNSPDKDIIREQFLLVNRYAMRESARNEEFAMNALELFLLLCDRENPVVGNNRQDPRIRLAMDYICKNCTETLSQRRLADVCSLSISRLSHLFKEQTGVSLQHYQEQQRLRMGKQLLELTSRSVRSIADELGYASPFYFSNRFRGATGFSPSEYRRQRS